MGGGGDSTRSRTFPPVDPSLRAHRPHILIGAIRRSGFSPGIHMLMISLKKPAAAAAGQG